MTPRFPWRAAAAACGTVILLHLLAFAVPSLVADAFCKPAAFLAALYFNAPAVFDSQGAVIARSAGDIEIYSPCSGFQFFTLLVGLTAFALADQRVARRHPVFFSLTLPAAYLITLVVNAGRIVAVAGGVALLQGHLPPDVMDALHIGTGVAVFLPVLLVSYFALSERRRSAHV